MADFEADTGIKVKVEFLTYADGDDKVVTAYEGKQTPDVIMEGPERLVANWGAKGMMLDISDLFDETAKANLIPSAITDCHLGDAAYEYPLCVNAFCMGINKTVFEAADAMQYLNAETHTWNSEENIQALKTLYDCEALEFDPGIAGGDEIALFYNGTLNVAFCWNAAQQTNPNTANTGAGLTANGDEILFMAFPADDVADIRLGCQNYGFGIFAQEDESKIAAAKEFIKYFCAGEGAPAAVRATNNFPADTTITGTYAGHEAEAILNEYNATMLPLAADYYRSEERRVGKECRSRWSPYH